jgi:DNA-binding MarR family transcriptional regulator
MEIEEMPLKQRQLLRVISENGGHSHTGELTSGTELSNDVVGYHMRTLVRDGLVERSGEVDVGAPLKAANYSITDRGREVADALPSETTREEREEQATALSELEKSTVQLEKEKRQLEKKCDELEGRLDEAEEVIEKHTEALQYLRDELGL